MDKSNNGFSLDITVDERLFIQLLVDKICKIYFKSSLVFFEDSIMESAGHESLLFPFRQKYHAFILILLIICSCIANVTPAAIFGRSAL